MIVDFQHHFTPRELLKEAPGDKQITRYDENGAERPPLIASPPPAPNADTSPPQAAAAEPEEPETEPPATGGAEVVRLDRFRKK